ncbi:isoprenyl transferase [Sphingomonas lacunae]|uniref:Isoprenyl transferase n=1 Tax=Sphingomonas lacunae TaxID=2698828 RepID=A0A6M4AVL7_9SPHN|nr:isoprenyl transferase [Sphingomonas lacunae]QJQ33163.1 isoprenyl transferase [Sphingomonas lacunae]
MADAKALTLPRHVAIIMDGNGRWAKKRLLPRVAGHRAGVEAVRTITRAGRDMGLEAMTLYAFSSENWKRPEDEVSALMGLLKRFIESDIDEFDANNVRLKIIGDLSAFSVDVREVVEGALARTADNTGSQLAIALNYGSQAELVRAARMLVEAGGPEAITVEGIEQHLYTADMPPLDLVIRTSGEQRLSNFLLWQAAYAEFWFTDVLWPDFSPAHLAEAVQEFGRRERRYGGL